MCRKPLRVGFGLFSVLLAAAALQAQTIIIVPPSPVPVPTPPVTRIRPTPVSHECSIRSVDTQVAIRDQAATVQISQVFKNESSQQLEAKIFFPLPDDAAISGLTLLVDGKELPGKLLKRDEARKIYEDIVRRQRDPALLEYLGQGLFQTSVFPVPAQGERKVELRYTQLLRKDQGLIDLPLPLGTNKHSTRPIETLNVTVRITSADAIKTVYSPTHKVDIERPDDTHAVCKLTLTNVHSPDDFRLLYGTKEGLVGMNVVSYRPNDKEDGYFLLLASPEVKTAAGGHVDKSIVFVVDRSGSMSGTKLEQAKAALKFVVQQLRPGDTFNIVAYDSAVESFRPELQRGDEAGIKAALGFVDGLFAGGSTNIDGALQTSLGMLQDKSRPSYVLFLTDGLPTVGELNELNIAKNAASANHVNARLFSFGVGFDVNSRLLDRLSRDQKGASAYVRPNENIETFVAALYNKIGSPLLTGIGVKYEFDAAQPEGAPAVTSRIYPRELTDLFQGEQLVIVGRYKPNGTAKVTLSGSVASEQRSFTFPANFVAKSADETNGFVEKLWATRRIGEIIDELDLKGQNQELIDELVQLSIKHGIITPYTSFLANENVDLAERDSNRRAAGTVVREQLSKADGREGFAQRRFKGELQAANQAPAQSKLFRGTGGGGLGGAPAPAASAPATAAPGRGRLPIGAGVGLVPTSEAAEISTEADNVRQLGQKTFFRKEKQWRDSSVTPEQEKQAIRMKQFSPEYFDLAASHGGKLSKYLVFDEPVLVNLDDKTYQIDPPDAPD